MTCEIVYDERKDALLATKSDCRLLATIVLCSLLFAAVFSESILLGTISAAPTVDLNHLMLGKWEEWDSLLTRWMDTNGSVVDLYDYSRRSRGHNSTLSLSSFGTYLLALTNLYEQTYDDYCLAKLRTILDAMIDSPWFYRNVTDIGTIFYTPHWWYDNTEREPAPIYIGYAGFTAVKLWKWTSQLKYKELADRIARETLKLNAVNNATDLAWSHAYYAGRNEGNATLGVNRQATITMFYSVYAKEINNTYHDFIPKTLHWQFRAQLASGGLAYSIGDSTENRPYTGFHMAMLLQGYLTDTTGYADYYAQIQNALTWMQSTKVRFSYAEQYFVLAALVLAWKSTVFTVDATLIKTYTFIGLNVLNHTLYGEFSLTADNAHGWRWSAFGLGSLFSSYPLPHGIFEVSSLMPIIDYTDLDVSHKNLVYNWDTMQGTDRLRYNTSYGVGLFHSNGLLKGLYFRFGSGQGSPASTISKGSYYLNVSHNWSGNVVKQYVYSFFTSFEVVGSRDFEIVQEAQNIMEATLANGTTVILSNMFNSTVALTDSFVVYYAAQNTSRFFVWSSNATWSLYNQTGYSRLTTTVTNGKVLVARLYKAVAPTMAQDALRTLIPYKDLPHPLTFDQVIQAYDDVKNKLGELEFGIAHWKQLYSKATEKATAVRLVMRNKPQEANITAWDFENERLAFTVSGLSNMSSITRIYVTDKGRPTALYVNNIQKLEGDGWSFDNTTKTIDVTTMNSAAGFSEVVIDWRVMGDVNADGVVNLLDLYRIAQAYGSAPGELVWDEDADLNKDNNVDEFDLAIIRSNFGNKKT